MQTVHRVYNTDARNTPELETNSVDLVVTSPPYPMIEMWDDLFATFNTDITDALENGNGTHAFDLMHDALTPVWDELQRVLTPGGIAAINIGDATRSVGNHFEVYPNHRRISREFTTRGFHRLPHIIWRKPTNSAAKFMGSGMIPPNAYPTLEHEYIMLFRNGTRRTTFEPDNIRYESAYFWEERNKWFTDCWKNITGINQTLAPDTQRDRSGAYPLEIPARLIQMFSVYGDTIYDPFWGTGTTTSAAIATGRNSIGAELDAEFIQPFTDKSLTDFQTLADARVTHRLKNHAEFVNTNNKTPQYTITNTTIPVVTKQEQDMKFYEVTDTTPTENGHKITHQQIPADDVQSTFSDLE